MHQLDGSLHRLVLPEPQYRPARVAQLGVVSLIPRAVPLQLRHPPHSVGPWPGAVCGTPMPEAAVDEHRQPETREKHVHATGDTLWPSVLEEPETASVKGRPQPQLRCRIAAPVPLHRAAHRGRGGPRGPVVAANRTRRLLGKRARRPIGGATARRHHQTIPGRIAAASAIPTPPLQPTMRVSR